MKNHSPLPAITSVILCLVLVLPPGIASQAVPAGQRAGQVSRMVPQVRIVRGTQQFKGEPNYPVDWGDLVNTERSGRARITLDDGSLINVGSESSVKITQYDPRGQQTQMDLTYGRLRSKVAKITAPNGKFEIRTPVGVAGVVGTDFYTYFMNGLMQIIVFEGQVRFCNLAGVCVVLGGGMMSTIRGENQPPDQPTNVTNVLLVDAGSSTEVVESSAFVRAAGPRLSPLAKIGLTALVLVPAVVLPIVVKHAGGAGAPPPEDPTRNPQQPPCNPQQTFCP